MKLNEILLGNRFLYLFLFIILELNKSNPNFDSEFINHNHKMFYNIFKRPLQK